MITKTAGVFTVYVAVVLQTVGTTSRETNSGEEKKEVRQ